MPSQTAKSKDSLTPVALSGVDDSLTEVAFIPPAAVSKLGGHSCREIGNTGIPAIAFCNSKSGGGKGTKILQRFKDWLGEDQVYDLGQDYKPIELLQKFRSVKNLRVVVCGGDGTMGWILSAIDQLNLTADEGQFPIAMMPLGTGNDLARQFHWGGGYTSAMKEEKWLHKVAHASGAILDRWNVRIVNKDPAVDSEKDYTDSIPQTFTHHEGHFADSGDMHEQQTASFAIHKQGLSFSNRHSSEIKRYTADLHEGQETNMMYDAVFCNYFSFGADAMAANAFHHARTAHPERFNSQVGNKMKYAQFLCGQGWFLPCHCCNGCCGKCCMPSPLLTEHCDITYQTHTSAPWRKLEIPSDINAIVVMNLQSFGGGINLFGDGRSPGYQAASVCDGHLEIIGVPLNKYKFLGGGALSGTWGYKLAQVAGVRIELRVQITMQIDGEPWTQPPCIIHLDHHNKSVVLQGGKESCGLPCC
jgi:diacylglycerol kinase (ATP)